MEKIIAPVEKSLLLKEISGLNENDWIIHDEHSVFVVQGKRIPNVMRELGRLREITFRDVGEGTCKEFDLDKFDEYYHQIVLWDKEKELIIGGYRLALSDEVIEKFGYEGLYLNTLYYVDPIFYSEHGSLIELGRSFIVKEYQKSYAPLLLLWSAIGKFIVRSKRYRRLTGLVSVSASYSALCRQIIAATLNNKYFKSSLTHLAKAHNPFVFDQLPLNIYEKTQEIKEFHELEAFVEAVDPESAALPVLLRHYIEKVNAKVLGVSVDPDFNNSLDCFIHVDIEKISQHQLHRFLGDDFLWVNQK
jgi:putative hemolysin